VAFFNLGLEVVGILLFNKTGAAGAGIEIHPVKVAGNDSVTGGSQSGCSSIEQRAIEAFRLGMCKNDEDIHRLGLSVAVMRTTG